MQWICYDILMSLKNAWGSPRQKLLLHKLRMNKCLDLSHWEPDSLHSAGTMFWLWCNSNLFMLIFAGFYTIF